MDIKGLDGKTYKLDLRNVNREKKGVASELHIRARDLIKGAYPTCNIVEEVYVPNPSCYFDFFIPLLKLAVEVQGEQHFKYNSHFFGNRLEFFRAQLRDKQKREFCDLNGFALIELPFNEDEEQWKQRLLNK